ISGLSGDMREILAAIKKGHSRAKLAFDIYVHRLKPASALWRPCWEELTHSFSPRESGKTRLKCGVRLAAHWNFLASNWIGRPTRNLLPRRMLRLRIRGSVSW